MMHTSVWQRVAATVALLSMCAFGQNDPNRKDVTQKDWLQMFNGKNLDGWVMKSPGTPWVRTMETRSVWRTG